MKKLILLVEDNRSDEKLTLLALRDVPIDNEVVVARDGVEAVEALSRAERLPSLVLLDLKLPRLDGLEVLQRIRAEERTKTLPVVILTSSREEEDITRSYAFGANAYVRKPVDFTDFVAAAKTIGVFWLAINEAPGPVR